MSWVYRLAIWFSLTLVVFSASGCATSPFGVVPNSEPAWGQVYELSRGATSLMVMKAIAGVPNGFVMINSLEHSFQVMFFWPLQYQRGTAFWIFDFKGAATMLNQGQAMKIFAAQNGAIGNCLEMACLVEFMKNNGWKLISADALNRVYQDKILEFITYNKIFPTFVILPVNTAQDVLDGLMPEPIQE